MPAEQGAPTTVFARVDRAGAVADIVGKLADAKINITATDAISAGGRYGCLCWVSPRDVKKAAQVLGAE